MGRHKIEEQNVRKLFKIGNGSYSLTIPIDIIRRFDWQEKQKLTIEADDKRKRIIIKDWER